MATQVPPKRATAFSFEIALVSQSDTDIFQTSVTLAAGDVKISKDGASFANIASLPTEIDSSGVLTVALSSTEMTADRIALKFTDAAGDEWQDALTIIHTASTHIDDLSTLGAGAVTFTYTLTSTVDSSPIADADVWATTDEAGNNVVASGTTNASGEVVFYLDAATYYIWRQKVGWDFTNPDTEVVA